MKLLRFEICSYFPNELKDIKKIKLTRPKIIQKSIIRPCTIFFI